MANADNNIVLDSVTPRPEDDNALHLLDPYPGTNIARHVELAITWQRFAMTVDLGPHLVGLSYADNLSGSADSLAIELEDRDSLWSQDLRPTFGDSVVARLKAESWFLGGETISLRLGAFSHDGVSFQGPPKRAHLKCVSAPLATGLRRRKRTRVWSGVTLKQIAQDIATRAKLTLDYGGDAGPPYSHRAQNNKSDLEFLDELCKDGGFTLKVTEGKIAIFDEQQLDATASSGSIDIIGRRVLSWTFDDADAERYGSCHVSFNDPVSGKTQKGQFPPDGVTVPGLDPQAQTLELVIPCTSIKEAGDRARAHLRAANRFATKGTITTIGDPGLVAGVTFNLVNAFGFDGKFIVTRAEHHPVGGYTTSIEVRRCIDGY